MTASMSPAEAQTSFGSLRAKIGTKAGISVFLRDPGGKSALYCAIQPTGKYGPNEPYLTAEADTFDELLAKAEAAWVEHRDLFRADTVAKMALAIIRLTDSVGECSEAMLRLEFDHSAVTDWGAEAVARANEMAARGPFSIKSTVGANRPLEDA